MDISLLREFLALSRNLSYSATAKQLCVSQSVLSKHIQHIEKELDTRLFVRDSRNVRLTMTGKLFADKVADIVKEYDDALRSIDEMKTNVSSALAVAFICDTTQDFFPKACSMFKERAPETDLRIYSMGVEEVVEAVARGTVDLGITLILLDAMPPGMVFSFLENEKFGVLVSPEHKLAKREIVYIDDLNDEKILLPDPELYPVISNSTHAQLSKAGAKLNLVEETQGLQTIGPLLRTRATAALTYGSVARFYQEDFVFIPLADLDIRAATGVLWKESRENAGIDLYISCLIEAFNECAK